MILLGLKTLSKTYKVLKTVVLLRETHFAAKRPLQMFPTIDEVYVI